MIKSVDPSRCTTVNHIRIGLPPRPTHKHQPLRQPLCRALCEFLQSDCGPKVLVLLLRHALEYDEDVEEAVENIDFELEHVRSWTRELCDTIFYQDALSETDASTCGACRRPLADSIQLVDESLRDNPVQDELQVCQG